MLRSYTGIALLLLTVACGGPIEPPAAPVAPAHEADLSAGALAPDFEFTDIDGETGRLSDYRGRIVLISGWATWCPYSREQMPQLVDVYRKYHDAGFDILGIASDDRRQDIRPYVELTGNDWRHVIEVDSGPIATLYHFAGVPSLVLIDRDGTIVEHDTEVPDLARHLARLTGSESQP